LSHLGGVLRLAAALRRFSASPMIAGANLRTSYAHADDWNRLPSPFVYPDMKKRSPFAAVAPVLGAVVCILVLAYLAGCGGGGTLP
jgi:hypothetical protein